MSFRRILALLAALFVSLASPEVLIADEASMVGFTDRDGSLTITMDGKPVATYIYNDPKISRPYFAHVHAPDGTQVTRRHPPVAGQDTMDHPEYHPGIWLAFGDLSGNDYWRLKAKVRSYKDDDVEVREHGILAFSGKNEYLDASDESKVVCTESYKYRVAESPRGYLLLVDSMFTSPNEFYFGDQEEMGLGIRVATPMRVEQGDGSLPPGTGTITDAKGRKNGAEVGQLPAELVPRPRLRFRRRQRVWAGRV
jgi:Methane oxygenase PmoA